MAGDLYAGNNTDRLEMADAMKENMSMKYVQEGHLSMGTKTIRRNISIEKLRILLMLGIITMHFLGHGGGILRASTHDISTAVVWLLESISYFSVNGFVLITGYFQCSQQFKWKKTLNLIVQITFWSIVCYAVTVFTGTESFSIKTFIKVIFPWLFGEYWFPSVYLGLYLLSPYLNKIVNCLEKREYQRMLIVATVLFCFPFLQESMRIGGGMSLMWFCHLYISAGYFRRFGIQIKRGILWAILMGCTAMLWIPNVVNISFFNLYKTYEWSYYSLPTYIGAVSLFLIFASKKQKSGKLDSFIQMVSGLTFGVFLIHDHDHLRVLLWNNVSKFLPKEGFTPETLWIIPAVIITVYCVCSCFEYLRQKLFEITHVNNLFR